MTASRVLLIDDESSVLDSLASLLEIEGFEIAGTASDLAGAVELAGSAKADVAILDINLGKELVFPAADVFVARFIPILFTSGRLNPMPARFASTKFIGKPYPPEVLLDQVQRMTSNVSAMRLAAQRNLEISAARLLGAMAKNAAESVSDGLKARPGG